LSSKFLLVIRAALSSETTAERGGQRSSVTWSAHGIKAPAPLEQRLR
jgi:hypothetical protein